MSVDDPIPEVLSIFLRRKELIDRLSEESADKRTLAEDLEYSRSTVDRAVRELETHDVLTYAAGRYELTPFGEQVRARTTDLLEEIEVARSLKPILQYLPAERFDLDLGLLADADVYLPEPGNPWAMVNQHVNVLDASNDIRALLPLTGLHAQEVLHERVVHHGARVGVVGCQEVVRTFLTDPNFATMTREMNATGRYNLYEMSERPPYFLGVLDEIVQIGVDQDGDPRGIVESNHPEVRAWAEEVYEQFKRQATPVEDIQPPSSGEESTSN